MTLEDLDRIDLVTKGKDGSVGLVIVDAGTTTDPVERLHLLKQKLSGYLKYIESNQFSNDHPDISIKMVNIVVSCLIEPAEEMRKIRSIRIQNNPGVQIPVSFDMSPFEQRTAEQETPSEPILKSKKPSLCRGCYNSDIEEVRLALESGADPNEKWFPFQAVVVAATAGDLEMIKLLVEYGAEITDVTANTMWVYAKFNGHKEVARYARKQVPAIAIVFWLTLQRLRCKRLIKAIIRRWKGTA